MIYTFTKAIKKLSASLMIYNWKIIDWFVVV